MQHLLDEALFIQFSPYPNLKWIQLVYVPTILMRERKLFWLIVKPEPVWHRLPTAICLGSSGQNIIQKFFYPSKALFSTPPKSKLQVHSKIGIMQKTIMRLHARLHHHHRGLKMGSTRATVGRLITGLSDHSDDRDHADWRSPTRMMMMMMCIAHLHQICARSLLTCHHQDDAFWLVAV